MYTRSRRARASLQMSLWADAIGGSARNLQRRREMGWKYREGAGQSTAALYAAEQAERRRMRNRRKTQAITAAIVVGVTVPAWAVVNAVSTPSAHNGLTTVSDGTALGTSSTTQSNDEQLAQLFSEAGQGTPMSSDVARARTASAAHQFDLPWATEVTIAPAPSAAKRAAVAPAETATAPDDLPDDAIVAPDEAATVADRDATPPDRTIDEPDRAATVPDMALPKRRESLDREDHYREHKHEGSRPADVTQPALPAPAAPSGQTAVGDPADPASNAAGPVSQTPAKPAAPTSGSDSTTTPATSDKPAVGDPAAPAGPTAGQATGDSGQTTSATSVDESGGGATKGERKGEGSKHAHAHGHVAKSDPAAP